MELSVASLESIFQNKKVLFVTTKNLDYIRNVQEIRILKKYSNFFYVIGSESNSYLKRITTSWWKFLYTDCSQYDLVFVGFSPQLIVPLLFWKFRYNIVIVDFFISVYDTLVCDRKTFRQKSIMALFCKWVDRFTLTKADIILSDTKAQGNYFSEEFGIGRKRIHTLYLEADAAIYYPRKIERNRELIGKYIVLYFGSALPLQGVDIVLEAVEKVSVHQGSYFIIIGPVNKKYRRPLRQNIEYYEWLPQKELAEKIAMADLCLAGHFNDKIPKAKRTIPGKAYIYHAMQKPMILGDNEATREIYDESMKGIHFVKMGDSDALAGKVLDLYHKKL